MEDKLNDLFDRAFLFLYKAALEDVGFSKDSELRVLREPRPRRSYIEKPRCEQAGE